MKIKKEKKWYSILYIQVIIAIAFGIVVGYLFPALGEMMKPLGDSFIKLVKMVITPLIFLTVVTGIAGMNNMKAVGRVAGKSMIYFFIFSTLALLLGMFVANTVKPGAGMNINFQNLKHDHISEYVIKAHESTITSFLMNIIPTTVFSPLVEGDVLQVLLVSVLFGTSLAMIGKKGELIISVLNDLSVVIFKLVSILMRYAPAGAFGAMAFTIGRYGIKSIGNLAFLVCTFYFTSLFFVLVILGAVAQYNGFSILKLIRYIKDELLLVLGTSSSEAALPNLMYKMEQAGCAKSVVGLVIPTGYSFNLDGTNIYMTLAALFIAQACNVTLSYKQQALLLFVAMISSKGAAGVTGAGFITLAATLAVVPEVPAAGMTLILGVDRFMSECRALTNFIGNACATVVIAKWEDQLNISKLDEALNNY